MCLKSLVWNAHSIKPKLSEFIKFIEDHKIDIILLSETWLKADEIFYLPLFNCYRTDRPYGGVAILIRKVIPHQFIKKIALPYAEAASIKIFDSNPFSISAIYCSPAASKVQAASFYDSVFALNGPHIVGGDFNAKHVRWNNTFNCPKGLLLAKKCSQLSYMIHSPNSATNFSPTGAPSTLDFVLSKQIFGISDPLTVNDLSSYHLPVILELPYLNNIPKDDRIFNFKKADWKKFKFELDIFSSSLLNSDFELNSEQKIDEMIVSINLNINKAAKKAIPLKMQFKPRHSHSVE